MAAAVLPLVLYGVIRLVADRFASGGLGDAGTVLPALGHPRVLAEHLGRMGVVLLVPTALAAGAWARTQVRPPRAASVIAAAIVVQPLLLNPAWLVDNEPRLTGLAFPALAVLAAPALRASRLGVPETILISLTILVSSFHERYSDVGIGHASL